MAVFCSRRVADWGVVLKHNEAKPKVHRTDRLRRTMKSSKNIISLWWRLAAKQTKSDEMIVQIHACMSEGKSDLHSYDKL